MDDCHNRRHTDSVQSFGHLFGIMSLPYFVIFGRVRDIQNRPFCVGRIFTVAIPRTSKRVGQKIFMAINNWRNNICTVGVGNCDFDIKHLARIKKFYYDENYYGNRNSYLFCECFNKL